MDIIERLYTYCQDILDGKILACKKHKQAVKRFFNDLKRIEDDDFLYEFDTEEVVNFYEWAKMFKHTKGALAGQYIELTDFQLFVVGNIFGWKNKKTGYRRFKKSYIQLARKNAKSQLLSLIASDEAFLSGQQAEVYVAGWGKEQSNIVYKEILSQIKACDLLQGKYSDSYHTITHLKSGSIIKALSREAKNLDGLNPSLCVIDEYHVHPTSEIYDVLVSGMAARPNGHICIITTAGFNLASPCYTEYQYVSKVLDENNPVSNEEYFCIIAEQDEEDNLQREELWIKSNPIVATTEEGKKFLRGELQQALDVPEKMRNVLTKNFNKWIQARENGYLPLDKWKLCQEDFSFNDFEGQPCLIGIDLSAKIDLTSMSFLFMKEDLVYVFNHSFMPEDTLAQKRKTDKVPYDLWINQGHITATTGSVVDYRFLQSYIKKIQKEYNLQIKEVCCDPWNGSQFMQELETDGFLAVEIPQRINLLAPPTKDFRERVYAGKIRHNNNPVLSWSIGNAITKADHNENIMLDKSKSTERIDPIASLITGFARITVLENGDLDLNEHILSEDFSF